MSRILLAWELGGNYGHLSKLLPLARLLRQRGHEPLFAVRDLAVASAMIGKEFPFLQTPRPSEAIRQPREPVSYADILAGAGFGTKDSLDGMLHAWRGLFDLIRPDVVVAQFAPMAIVAARQTSIPTIRPDTGFESPPQTSPFPCFRPWLKVSPEALLEKEAELLVIINTVCGGKSRSLNSVLQADLTLLTTLPELDHYPGRQGGRYIGPLFQTDEGDEIPWQTVNRKRVFAYLRPFPELPALLDELKKAQVEVIAAIPGADCKLADSFSTESFRIVSGTVRLDRILPQADLAISHGGHGLTSACLLHGVPSLAIPTMIEQLMTARNLERLKTGAEVTRAALRKGGCGDILNSLLTDTTYKEHSEALAEKYQSYDHNKTFSRLARTIERMAEGTKKQTEELPAHATTT